MATPFSEDKKLFNREAVDGEYATWNRLPIYDLTAAVDVDDLYVNNKGTMTFDDGFGLFSGTLTKAGVLTWLASNRTWYLEWRMSATFKYYLDRLWFGVGIDVAVMRDGIVIWTDDLALPLPTDALSTNNCAISPSGQYLAFVVRGILSGVDQYIFLYEGE